MGVLAKLTSVLPNNSIKGAMPRKPMSTVYVENSNNTSSLEDIMYANDVTLGFSSRNFGSQNLFRFSRTYQFLAQIVIELELDQAAIPFSDYISYSALEQIRFSIGGTELLSINGKQMLNIVLEQCETQEKKEALLDASGRREFTTSGTAGNNANYNIDVQTNIAIGADKKYYAIIPCPWSSLSKMNKIKPLPLHMLSEPIELQIVFKKGSEFCGGVTSFKKANLHFRYGKLGNQEQLKNQVYRWPFHSHFSHEYTLSSGQNSVDLNGFRKGEVTQLLFHFVPNGPTTSDDAGITDKRYFDGKEVSNLKLTFNGQVIWEMPGEEHRIWNLIDGIGYECRHNKRRLIMKSSNTGDANSVNKPVAGMGYRHTGGQRSSAVVFDGDFVNNLGLKDVAADANNTLTAQSRNRITKGRYVYYRIPISEVIAECQKQGHYIGADFTKQSIKLEFNPLQAYNGVSNVSVPANVSGKLYVTYTYRAIYQFDGESALLVF